MNILTQENNHLRQLLELADSDSGISLPPESSVAMLAQLGMDKNGAHQPLDGRGMKWVAELDSAKGIDN